MKLAIIGSRSITDIDLSKYIPEGVTEIVSGGAKGVDTCAAAYAQNNGIALTVFLPDYARYNRGAPLKRNEQIAEYADEALVFWDGKSRGTAQTIRHFRTRRKPYSIIQIQSAE